MAALMNFVVSLVLPLWGIAVTYVGLHRLAMTWVGCGVAVLLVGLILMAGNPWVADPSRRP
jgi:uncharacterized membrane protein YccC